MSEHVTHIGTPHREMGAILDAHLPTTASWRVTWEGERASIETDGGSFTLASGTVWGPYWMCPGPVPEVVHEGFKAVRGPLIDRLLAKMAG
jgi:hypothetical protein